MTYRTSGNKVYHDGQELQLFGVNYFGFESKDHVLHGLWDVSLEYTLDMLKGCGFNAVRLPYSPELLKNPETKTVNFSVNPKLQGMRGLDVLDRVVDLLEARGIRFVLDHHSFQEKIIPLWYAEGYPESQWIADLQMVAKRYKGRKSFIGIDIKNEPHDEATWGTGNARTDWNLAAERAYKAIDSVNSDILIFVEGTSADAGNWGEDLSKAGTVKLNIPKDRFMFAPHSYGPSVFPKEQFKHPDYPKNLLAKWKERFLYLTPEYGLCLTEIGGTYVNDDKEFLDEYYAALKADGTTNLFFWSWNANSGDTGGILGLNNDRGDWKHVNQAKLKGLKDALHTPFATFLGQPSPKPTPAPSPAPVKKHKFKVGDKIHANNDPTVTFKVEGLQTHADGKKYARVSGVVPQDKFSK